MSALRSVSSISITLLLSLLFDITQSQSDPFDTFDTTIIDEDLENTFAAPWLITMVISGMIGMILVATLGAHTIYRFYHDKINEGFSRYLYMSGFLTYWLTCLGYALFRINLILPMGSVINCKIGYYLTTNGVFFSKLILFTIFIFRIDLAFHASALGYHRGFLLCTSITYIVIICLLNGMFIYATWDLVELITADYTIFGTDIEISMCGIGTTDSDDFLWTVTLGLMFIGDVLFSLFVCGLFVYKLKKVIGMTKNDHGSKLSQSSHDKERTRKLSKVARKQTTLVLIACISSFLVLALNILIPGVSLLMPIDAIINTLCVWFMFQFADSVWNKVLHTICFCCYCCKCCGEKDDFMMTMRSMSRKYSIKSVGSISGGKASVEMKTNTATDTNTKQDIDIIKFDNNIKSEDLDLNKNKNKKKLKITTTTTETTTKSTTTTIKKELIEEQSVESPHVTPTTSPKNDEDYVAHTSYIALTKKGSNTSQNNDMLDIK